MRDSSQHQSIDTLTCKELCPVQKHQTGSEKAMSAKAVRQSARNFQFNKVQKRCGLFFKIYFSHVVLVGIKMSACCKWIVVVFWGVVSVPSGKACLKPTPNQKRQETYSHDGTFKEIYRRLDSSKMWVRFVIHSFSTCLTTRIRERTKHPIDFFNEGKLCMTRDKGLFTRYFALTSFHSYESKNKGS